MCVKGWYIPSAMVHFVVFTESPAEPANVSDHRTDKPSYEGGVPAQTSTGSTADAIVDA